MEGTEQTIVVDGTPYSVRFRGFGESMDVRSPEGKTVAFPPWTYRCHMEALRKSLRPALRGLALDTGCFSACVLQHCDLAGSDRKGLEALALWWASGGETPTTARLNDEWLDLGPVRVRLKGWNVARRFRALARCMVHDHTGEGFDVVGYLDAMVRATLRATGPMAAPDELDSAATAILIRAVVDLNLPQALLPEPFHADDDQTARKQARDTLNLCALLGWTPSRVWNTPAAEVDRLAALAVFAGPETGSARHSGLAQYPDAVVISFGDDG